jgi:hypothetical protein
MNVYPEHPSEETLERFLLNNLSELELEELETHVLACGHCVGQLEGLEMQITATRMALQSLEAQRVAQTSLRPISRWKSWFTIPKVSFAATGLVAAAAAVLFSIPQNVTLAAYRGSETAVVSEGRPVHVHLNAAGLDAGGIAIELADRQGSIEWKGISVIRPNSETLDLTLPRITKSGPHFLRLFSLPQTGSESLLREFALNAKWAM